MKQITGKISKSLAAIAVALAWPSAARAQEAPPIPDAITCNVNPAQSGSPAGIPGCELDNIDLFIESADRMSYNGAPCYTGVGGVTLFRQWVDSQNAITASYERYSYQVGVYEEGVDQLSYAKYGQQPCYYALPNLVQPLSMAQGHDGIAESYNLSCPPNTTAYDTWAFICECNNGLAWNGAPWPSVPGAPPASCAVPPVTQGGPAVMFTVACSGGSCQEDGRATFKVTRSNPWVYLAYVNPGVVSHKNVYVTSGCCTQIPVTWTATGRRPGPATGLQAMVPIGSGASNVQIHFTLAAPGTSAQYTAQAR